MFQVNASYKAVSVEKRKIGFLGKMLGMPEINQIEKDGTVQFTANSINESITKLQYLVQDINSVYEMTIKRI